MNLSQIKERLRADTMKLEARSSLLVMSQSVLTDAELREEHELVALGIDRLNVEWRERVIRGTKGLKGAELSELADTDPLSHPELLLLGDYINRYSLRIHGRLPGDTVAGLRAEEITYLRTRHEQAVVAALADERPVIRDTFYDYPVLKAKYAGSLVTNGDWAWALKD